VAATQPIILCAVRWYLRYALSYRDVEELMRERGVWVDHTTVFRWVQCYAPELDKRCRPQLKATNDSYRVDETYRYCWRKCGIGVN
jgi:IS6 family transposase